MKKASGFITLHRQILDWEWYRYPHTAFLFIHLLLSANFVDGQYKGTTIKRGQLVRSVTGLSTETGLTIQTVKTALAHLQLTGEITSDTSRGYRVITIVKYNDFQKLTDKSTANQPQTNRQSNRKLTDNPTTNQPLYNNNNNINNGMNEQHNNTISSPAGFEESFSAFWEIYPKKVSKPDALKAWNKLKPDSDLMDEIMTGLYRWKASDQWNRDSGQYIPYPATWLNKRRWEDDVPTASKPEPAPVRQLPANNFPQRDYSNEDLEIWQRMIEMEDE